MAGGAQAAEADDWVTGSDGPDDWITPPSGPSRSSAAGAFARGAERGALPAAGGFAGFAAGAEAGAAAGALTGPAAPVAVPALAFVGGMGGAYGGASAVDTAQRWVMDHAPPGIAKALGFDKEQESADAEEHPVASFAGELAPNLALVRPGAIAKAVEEGAPAIEKLLANPVTARAVPAAIMGTQEAASEGLQGEPLDPTKIAIATGVGALSNRETALGQRLGRAGAAPVEAVTTAIRDRIHPGPTPDEVAAPVMAAGSVDEAIGAAQAQVDQPSVDVDGMAAEARRQAEASEQLPEQAEPAAEAVPSTTEEIGPEGNVSGAKTAETGPEEITPAPATEQPSAREFPPFADAKLKADTYNRWLGELDQQRRDQAAASPQARFLQQTIGAILNKVNGVEDRLTKSGAERLQDTRLALDELLNPQGDNPDMARVRASMVAEQQNMADAVVAHRDQALSRAQQAREQARVLEEPLSDDEADDIASHMVDHQIDAGTAVADHIERQALQEVQSDHAATGDQAYAEAIPVRGGEGEIDRGAGDGSQGPAPFSRDQGGENASRIPAPEITSQARELAQARISVDAGEASPSPRIEPVAKAPALEARGVPAEITAHETPSARDARVEPIAAAAAPEVPVRAKALKAIEGEGSERERAINGATYNVGTEAPQLEAAARLVETDPEQAIAVAMRQRQPPPGVHPEFVYMAVENKAISEGDVDLQYKLRKSKIAEEATTMGQRIAAYRNRAEINPVEDMRRIEDARVTKAKERGIEPEAAVDDMVTKAQAEIKRTAKSSKRPAWNDFLLQISCAD